MTVGGHQRPCGGIVVAAGVMIGLPDWVRWFAAIGIGGAVTTTGHALTAVGRAKTGAISGGLGNPLFATGELAASLLLATFALLLPFIALAVAVAVAAYLVQRRRRRAWAAGS